MRIKGFLLILLGACTSGNKENSGGGVASDKQDIIGNKTTEVKNDHHARPDSAAILVSEPQPNELISSPLTVSGKARGYWFFEANFPVELQDEKNKTIATASPS